MRLKIIADKVLREGFLEKVIFEKVIFDQSKKQQPATQGPGRREFNAEIAKKRTDPGVVTKLVCVEPGGDQCFWQQCNE